MIQNASNQINFNGKFQGLKIGKRAHAFPRKPLKGCSYSDRLMMRVVRKTLNSKKYQKDLNITLENTQEGKNIVCDMKRSSIKNFIPLPIRVLGGRMFNLPNEKFWRILADKRVDKIRYHLPEKHFNDTIEYFTKQRTASEQLENFKGEDPRITNKSKKFKKALMNFFTNDNDKKWLNEYFTKLESK